MTKAIEQGMNVLIAGVGGQGTVLASKILSQVALAAGYDVKQSEIHGMSQRGGSVVTHIRYGEKVYSPLVAKGQADVIMAFEELEALRYLPYLKEGGLLILNLQQMLPMPVISGSAAYPQNIAEEIKGQGVRLEAAPAAVLALEQGDARAANVVLLGMLARHLSFPKELWQKAIQDNVKDKFIAMNLKAFEVGYQN
jgi:indolepyruvate ferredoxin oxidoreductase beta subunit